jgi:hypothetical protein
MCWHPEEPTPYEHTKVGILLGLILGIMVVNISITPSFFQFEIFLFSFIGTAARIIMHFASYELAHY